VVLLRPGPAQDPCRGGLAQRAGVDRAEEAVHPPQRAREATHQGGALRRTDSPAADVTSRTTDSEPRIRIELITSTIEDRQVPAVASVDHLSADVGRAVFAENYAAHVAEYREPSQSLVAGGLLFASITARSSAIRPGSRPVPRGRSWCRRR
jgi:hypothetical protein